MTWPNTQVSTSNLDSGTDSPALARANIKSAVDNLNSLVAEFNVSTPADYQVLQYAGNVWVNQQPQLKRYSEPVHSHGSTSGNITVNYNNGNFQTITATGNIALTFTNAPDAGTVTLLVTHGDSVVATFSNANVKYSGNVRSLTSTAATDMIVATTVDTGGTYYVSIVKGFV
jgi:hypothetical protein